MFFFILVLQMESLALLTPIQVAQLTLSSGALNDTDKIDPIFDRLEEGDSFANVDEFLTQLTAKGKVIICICAKGNAIEFTFRNWQNDIPC